MHRFTSGISAAARVADKLAWLAVFGMMGLVALNLISRRFGYPILGTYDYVGFLLILIIAPALANCAFKKGHIYLSILTDRFSHKDQLLIEIFVATLNFLLMGLITWLLLVRALRMMDAGLTGMTSSVPVYPFIFIEALAVLLLCLAYLTDIIEAVNRLVRER